MAFLATLIKGLYPLIKVLFPTFQFNPVTTNKAKDAFAKIQDIVSNAKSPTGKALGKKALSINRIDQYKINEPNNQFSCLYSDYCMACSFIGKKVLVPEKYDDACRDIGAMNKSFKILDHDKMLIAGGLKGYRSEYMAVKRATISDVIARVIESINNNLPAILSLDGNHYQLINGYEKIGDEFLLKIVDPGGWNDTHIETSSMRVFKFKGEKRIYSTHGGVHRVVTSIRFIVKVA